MGFLGRWLNRLTSPVLEPAMLSLLGARAP